MASFFTPSSKRSTTTPPSTRPQSTPKTTAAVVVTPDRQVVVWSKVPRLRQNSDDKWQFTLNYYAFYDDKTFHAPGLLVDTNCTRVTHPCGLHGKTRCQNKESQMPSKKVREVKKMLFDIEQMIATRADLTDEEDEVNSAAAAPTSLAQIHNSFPKTDAPRIESAMAQLLLPSSQISFRGDVQIASHPWIQKSLGFWLHAEGILQGGVPDAQLGRFHVQPGTMNSHLLLDRTAASCIHLLPPPNAGAATVIGGKSHNNSLLGILSQPSMTKMGKRLMERWLRQPLIDLKAIVRRQDAVELLVNEGVGRDQLRSEGLRNFNNIDIAKLAAQLGLYDGEDQEAPGATTQGALKALYQLYLLNAQKLPLLLDALTMVVCPDGDVSTIPMEEEEESESASEKQTLLQSILVGLQRASNELARSQELAETVLNLDAAPREYLIKSSFKEELHDIKEELDSVEARVEECHREMNELWAETEGLSLDSNHVRLDTFGENDSTKEWQFRIPDQNASKVLMNGPLAKKVKVHRILKNGVYFSTKEIQELSSKKQDLIAEYDRHQKQVVQDVMKVAATYQGPLERTNELVALLDVLVSLAHVAAYSAHGYVKPTLTDSDEDDGNHTERGTSPVRGAARQRIRVYSQ